MKTAAGGTLLFDVVEMTWTFDEAPPTLEEVPADLRVLTILIPPTAPDGTSSGTVHVLGERAAPSGNPYASVRVEWVEETESLATASLGVACSTGRSACDERIASFEWEEISFPDVEACVYVNESDIVFLEWERDDSRFHFESGSMSEADAVAWLQTWTPLR